MSVKERLKKFIKSQKISISAFEKSIDASNGYVNSISKGIGADKSLKINREYSILNMDWLLSGNGQMLKTSEVIEVDFAEINVMFVPLVSKFAYAGYLDNMGDDEYVEELPKIPFANDVQNRGDYLCFEVKGDSMDNGEHDAILEGDILLCRNVKQEYWRSKLHINKWDFVIVHRERGVLIKRITEHNTNTHEITLHSLNDYYDDIKIHLKDVQAIFNVVDLRRKRNRR
jgi:phage repressor protein C with HTH and peptisase S24 domain